MDENNMTAAGQTAPAAAQTEAPPEAAEQTVTVGALRGAIERRQEQSMRRAAEQTAARWSREADALTAQCPDFDLGAALNDDRFCALLRAGIDGMVCAARAGAAGDGLPARRTQRRAARKRAHPRPRSAPGRKRAGQRRRGHRGAAGVLRNVAGVGFGELPQTCHGHGKRRAHIGPVVGCDGCVSGAERPLHALCAELIERTRQRAHERRCPGAVPGSGQQRKKET